MRLEDRILVPTVVQLKHELHFAGLDRVGDHGRIHTREEQNRSEDEQNDTEGEAEAHEELFCPVSLFELAPRSPLIRLVLAEVHVVESIVQTEPLE